MAFLAPYTLLGLALVSLPVLIHLLVRRRGRPIDFPSLKFLRETPSFKLRPRRLRQPLLLALRAAAIILFVTGLARPLVNSGTKTPEVLRFILIDASLSMKTRGRVEAAKEQARAIVSRLGRTERASVIAVSDEAVVLSELTSERERLMEAITRYQPAGGSIDYSAAFNSVRTQLLTEPQVAAHVEIISDFQQAGLEDDTEIISREATQFRILTHGVGSRVERNAFLTDEMTWGRSERGLSLAVTEIVAEADGRSGTRRIWAMEGNAGVDSQIQWRTEANNQIAGSLKIAAADDFDADDERFFAFTPGRENRVLLIEDETDATVYLSAALEASAGREETMHFDLDKRKLLPESAADLVPYSLIITTLHGAALERETHMLLEYARGGGVVWMFLARDLDAASWNNFASGEAGQALPFERIERKTGGQTLTFGAMDTDATELRALDESSLAALRAVRVGESYQVMPRAQADTLIRWSDGTPAFISARTGSGRIILLGTSVERASSELGLTPAFPALASSISRAADFEREPLSQVIGEAVRLNARPETEVRVTNAQGVVKLTKARELVRRPFSYFSEPGIYQLEFAGQQKFMAFNAPVHESEPALVTIEELKRRFPANEAQVTGTVGVAASLQASERSGHVWRYFLCAAFLLMIAELFVAMRAQRQSAETVSE